MDRLKNKVAVVTGAAGGMGEADARIFALEGAKVIMVDIDGPKLQEAAAHITELGGIVYPIEADVAFEESWETIVKTALDQYGKIDILVNNAGISGIRFEGEAFFPCTLSMFDGDMWKRVIDVQLWGPIYGMKHVYPVMKENGGGSIINVTSLSAFCAMGGASPYTTAKSGIWGLTRAAASDFAPDGIRVNAMLPGIVKTNLLPFMDDETHPWMLQEGARIKMRKEDGTALFGEPDDAAYVALFYASDESRYITGTRMPIDGGYLTY